MTAVCEAVGLVAGIGLVVAELALVVALVAVAGTGALDLVARVARYRQYRRSFPAAARGQVWAHVRDPRYRQR